MAEALLNHLGEGRIIARSAGCAPTGAINRNVLEILDRHGIDPGVPVSKSWNALTGERFDLVIGLGDELNDETWPLFRARPEQIIWPIQDPAEDIRRGRAPADVYEAVFAQLTAYVRDLIEHNLALRVPR